MIHLIAYNQNTFDESNILCDSLALRFSSEDDTSLIYWINIDGVNDIELLKCIGKIFNIHHLTIEDIMLTRERPKIDEFENYTIITIKMLSYNTSIANIQMEHVSIVFGKNFVITFQEEIEGDVFEKIRAGLRNAKGRIRKMGSDFLAYSLIDSVVDSYFSILEAFGERIEDIEEELVQNPSNNTLTTIYQLRKMMLKLHQSVWPLRDVINSLARGESQFIENTTIVYVRDVYDHTVQIIDILETNRDILTGMIDIYLSSTSNRLNFIMKVLTIITTIFMPLSLIAGIYGMNFRYMPELEWRWGYLYVIVLMIAVSTLMLGYMRHKGWL